MFAGKRKLISVLMGVAVIGVAGYWWQSRTSTESWFAVLIQQWQSQTPQSIWVTEPVIRGNVLETVSVVGRLEPEEYANLSFVTMGTVSEILVKPGEAVRQGDVLVVLDTSVLQSEMQKASLALLIAEETEKLAHRTWDELKPEERAVKRLATEQARADLQTIRAEKEKSVLIAPMDGILSKLDIRVGETVTAGTVVGRISGTERFLLKADVPEADIAKMTPGKSAEVTFDALSSNEKFLATIESVEPSSTVIQDVIYYTATFELFGQHSRLKEGMSADIDVIISKRKRVLVVPYRALGREGPKVFVEVAQNGIVSERRDIEIGIEGDDGSTEVLSGLREGEEVVVSRRK